MYRRTGFGESARSGVRISFASSPVGIGRPGHHDSFLRHTTTHHTHQKKDTAFCHWLVLMHRARIVCPEPVLGKTIILGIKWRRQKGVFGGKFSKCSHCFERFSSGVSSSFQLSALPNAKRNETKRNAHRWSFSNLMIFLS
jgi:hypothetical protein